MADLLNEEKIIIPDDTIKIKYAQFMGNETIKSIEIPETVKKIDDIAFKNCKNLESITISSGVKEIGEAAFEGCIALRKVIFCGGVGKILSRAFCNCKSLEEIVIPDGVQSIRSETFSGCENLERVTIPASVRQITKDAFKGCIKLKDVRMSEGIKAIGSCAFEGCCSLESINIPATVKKLGWFAFNRCSALKDIVIPSGMITIDSGAFCNCKKLVRVELSETVCEMGSKVFMGCSALERIDVAQNNSMYSSLDGVLFDKEQKVLKKYPQNSVFRDYIIPDGVEVIDKEAFEECIGLISLTIPDCVKESADTSALICADLSTVRHPDKIKKTEQFVFESCSQLKQINISEENKKWLYKKINIRNLIFSQLDSEILKDALSHTRVSNKKALVILAAQAERADILKLLLDLNYLSTPLIRDEVIDIVSKMDKGEILAMLLEYKNRTADIEKEEKAQNKRLERELNMSVEELLHRERMKQRKFWQIKRLEDGTVAIAGYKGEETIVEIPAEVGNKKVSGIADGAFYFLAPRKTQAMRKVFANITEIIIEEGISFIGNKAFCFCENLERVTIPKSVKIIGEYAFSRCKKFENIVIPDGVTDIGRGAFWDCTNLKTLTIPASVTYIGYSIISRNTDTVIHAPAGSFAIEYAKRNRYRFIEE